MKLFPNGLEIDDLTYQLWLNNVPNLEEWIWQMLKDNAHHISMELRTQWVPQLQAEGVQLPIEHHEIAKIVLAHPEYRNYQQRLDEKRAAEKALEDERQAKAQAEATSQVTSV